MGHADPDRMTLDTVKEFLRAALEATVYVTPLDWKRFSIPQRFDHGRWRLNSGRTLDKHTFSP